MHKNSHCIYHIVCICTDDLSKNKTATQSTTAIGPAFEASNAVDRDITTCMRTVDIGLTSSSETVWWKVDLGGLYNIYSVNILFKNHELMGMYT